jgi:hypothetical protein
MQSAWSVRLWRYMDHPHRGWVNLLYSDAQVTGIDGTETVGRYRFTPLADPADRRPGQLRPVLELASWFRHPDQQPATSGSAGWTGLTIHQEVAALASLVMGIRLRGDDPRPRYRQQDDTVNTYEVAAQVVPSAPSSPWGSPILPGMEGSTADFGPLRPHLESLPRLSPQHTVQLVRAARQYADALWMAEGEPELAWLMLVSAVEVAATAHQAATEDYALLVKEAFPRSAEALVGTGGESLLAEAAATEFEGLVCSTGRFLAFARNFLPDPPTRRTADPAGQLPWSKGKMREALSTVYRLRSAASRTSARVGSRRRTASRMFDDSATRWQPLRVPCCASQGRGAGWCSVTRTKASPRAASFTRTALRTACCWTASHSTGALSARAARRSRSCVAEPTDAEWVSPSGRASRSGARSSPRRRPSPTAAPRS